MANGKFDLRGLLYSPEILGGLGLLGQGFAGKTPSVQPIMQGMQTANIFDIMQKRKERDVWAEEYTKTLPEGSFLKSIFKYSPDKGMDYVIKTKVAEINAANKQTNAMRNALAKGLVPNTKEYNDFIDAVTIKSDLAWQSMQEGGQVMSKGKRDQLVIDNATITKVLTKLKSVKEDFKVNPQLAGGVGTARRWANKLGTLAKDVGWNIGVLEGEFAFDEKIANITALETALIASYAKILYPGKQITKPMLQAAKESLRLTGLTGSGEVIGRLDQIEQDFKDYIETNRILLGDISATEISIPKKSEKKLRKYKIGRDGKLVEVRE